MNSSNSSRREQKHKGAEEAASSADDEPAAVPSPSRKSRRKQIRHNSVNGGGGADDVSVDPSVDSQGSGSGRSGSRSQAAASSSRSGRSSNRRPSSSSHHHRGGGENSLRALDSASANRRRSTGRSISSDDLSTDGGASVASGGKPSGKRRSGRRRPSGDGGGSSSSDRRQGNRKSDSFRDSASGDEQQPGSDKSQRRKSAGGSRSFDSSTNEGAKSSSPKSKKDHPPARSPERRLSQRDLSSKKETEAPAAPLPAPVPAPAPAAADAGGWGDFPSFPPAPAADDGASFDGGGAFGGFATDFADSNFDNAAVPNVNFDAPATDAGFAAAAPSSSTAAGGASPGFPSSNAAAASAGSADSAAAFDTAFGSFDAAPAFPSTPDPSAAFGSMDGFDQAFSATASFNEQKEPEWDSSPLTDIPKRSPGKLTLVQASSFSGDFAGSPATNRLNGNVIFCSSTSDGYYLHEIDPLRDNVQIASAPVFSLELQHKVATKYNVSIHCVEGVVTLTTGLHRLHGQTRVRVAAVLDLKVLETHQLMRVVAVWQWGYGSPQPVALQHVMTPPSGGDFTYDPTTLQVSDSLLFVAGSSPKGPCVFMCKPTVRESWSANFLSGGGKVATMRVTPDSDRRFHHLAVALTDRSLSIWTYEAAVGSGASKGNEPAKRWLFPLCRLEGALVLSNVEATSLTGGEGTGQDSKDVGHCTHLSWLPPQPSLSSLPLIAAAFQNGMAIFHIGMPVVADSSKAGFRSLPDPTSGTQLSQTPAIWPLVAKRWRGKHDQSFVAWLNFGPHVNPCLAILLHSTEVGATSARVVLGTINFPVFRKGPMPKERLVPFRILSSVSISKASDSFPVGLLRSSGLKSVLCYSQSKLVRLSPSMSSAFDDAAVASLGFPIATDPPGLTSEGDTLLAEGDTDKEGILHIYTVAHCERQKNDSDSTMLDWSRPTRRHWLCRTVAGDSKASGMEETKDDKSGASDFGGSETVSGGALSDVVCELYDDALVGLSPFRVVRCHGTSFCAVLFRPAICAKAGAKEGLSLDAVSIAFVDFTHGNAAIQVVEGRDVSFWPKTEEGASPRGVILSRDGSSLTYFTWQGGTSKCQLGKAFRPILGVDTDKNYVECRRVFTFAGASKLGLLVVGTRLRDGCSCVLTGDLASVPDVKEDAWSNLLPNIVSGRSMWLEKNEEVFNVIGLQGDDSGYRNFALATSRRVMILSSALKSSAEMKTKLASCALAPLGSFAVCFCSDNKIRYLCCLDGPLVNGLIATLPIPKNGFVQTLLMAVRPDRLLLYRWHNGTRLVERGQNAHTFLLPTALTRPALLLEPMVANAVCVGGKQPESTPVLRTVIEKFGRVASITHGENEGIGKVGAGLSPQVFAILSKYGLKAASSWLLTGITQFDRAANTKILPPWLPIAPKMNGAPNSDACLHLLASGDQYFSDYIKSPDQNPPTLPRPSDPSAYLSREFASGALRRGEAMEALKMLDIVGSESTDSLILQLSLVLEKDQSRDITGILKSMSGYDETGLSRSSAPVKAPTSLAALAVTLKLNRAKGTNQEMSRDQVDRWMKPLAPSLQRSTRTNRVRQRIFGEKDLASAGARKEDVKDPFWVSPCNETKHVWNEGPRKEKENLLMLDKLEDWLGRRRPTILGKEGVSMAQEGGANLLAGILNTDDDSFGGKSDLESEKDGWVEGVGEGRSDEANLSGYFRMSEGEDEDSAWRSEGLADLSPYQNKIIVVGDGEAFSLQPSTSSVDEGEPGKVKSLYDVVFDKSGQGHSSGLAISADRGGSIDVGMLHGPDRQARQKCTIEFWYYLPSQESTTGELVLARRTMGPSADDFSKVGVASDKESVLWEVILRTSGELEFRSCAGSSFLSSKNYVPAPDDADDDSDDEKERSDLAVFERWNHLCMVFNSKGQGVAECNASMYMKGTEVASEAVSMLPHGFDADDLDSAATLDEIMQKSHLLFGLDHGAGFRVTELRIWACERSAEDTQSFLYEYLTAAESKKKFKVKIKNKRGGGPTLGKGAFLTPPKSGGLAPPKGMLAAPKGGLAPPKATLAPTKTTLSLAPPPPQKEEPGKFSLAPPPEEKEKDIKPGQPEPSAGFEAAFGTSTFEAPQEKPSETPTAAAEAPAAAAASEVPAPGEQEVPVGEEENASATLWDTALPLSQQVRSSAAAALIRGPPATRHFGGNRGGLPDYIGVERFGVGGIAICGSEKTIVWRDNEDPPALTYPIGASGAIVSDQMDDEGSEFLCCFLAKEKRMVVFELQSRTVVVELQMTTKLNFWRFLPPEAGENTLCFMLVTPVGGFHWMPLEESPRPHQVWKRGEELQGKKVVSYEEGGSNGLEGAEILSRVGLVMVTKGSGGSSLEAWIVPISGDSRALQVSDDVMGSCLCLPRDIDDGPFLPLLVTIHQLEEGMFVNVLSVTEASPGSLELGEVEVTQEIDESGFEDIEHEPPTLAMGTYPEAICCSLANIVVVIVRRKGLIAAFELEESDLSLIAREDVGHYVIDAVMRYSVEVGGAEIVMLLSDNDNPKDGRLVSFCFRSAA